MYGCWFNFECSSEIDIVLNSSHFLTTSMRRSSYMNRELGCACGLGSELE